MPHKSTCPSESQQHSKAPTHPKRTYNSSEGQTVTSVCFVIYSSSKLPTIENQSDPVQSWYEELQQLADSVIRCHGW